MVRWVYRCVQRLLAAAGIYFVVTRISRRNQPELINRALWKPFAVPDHWRLLYESAQSVSGGASTDNIYRQCRFYSTFQLAAYAASLPEGDVIECGCWHGHTAIGIATILSVQGFSGRFDIFDAFEGGLSEFTPKDDSIFGLSAREKAVLTAQFASDYEFVRSITSQFGFVELHRGWIPQSFASFSRRPTRFVHLDVDMYEPTKASLEFFWEVLVPGGCIVVDDYNHTVFEGATRAVDEFLQTRRPRLFYKVPFGGSCFFIKD